MAPATRSKRPHAGNGQDGRPAKLQKTGLEASGIFDDMTPKVSFSKLTKVDQALYQGRSKLASHALTITRLRKKSKTISPSWKGMKPSNEQGMSNFTGALCYRHSLFQAMLHNPKITNSLTKSHQQNTCFLDGASICVGCEFSKVVSSYWSGDKSGLTTSLRAINEVFKQNQWTPGSLSGQADPEEQFTWLAQTLSAQLPSETSELFHGMYQFVLNSSTHCKKCDHSSSVYGETEGILSVELLPRIANGSLAQYLHKYLAYKVTDYKCNSCKDTAEKQRTRKIAFSPDVIIIQLKRFSPFNGSKDKYPIPFSSTLNLNSYRTTSNTRNSVYEVSSVISHTGSTNSGHYCCIAKGPEGAWKVFNDDSVSNCSEAAALNPGDGKGWTPYILFFQRKSK